MGFEPMTLSVLRLDALTSDLLRTRWWARVINFLWVELVNHIMRSCGHAVHHKLHIVTLARQRVLSSSEVRASDLEHGGLWVRIPSGAQIFSVPSYGRFFFSLYFLIYISLLQDYYFDFHPFFCNIWFLDAEEKGKFFGELPCFLF